MDDALEQFSNLVFFCCISLGTSTFCLLHFAKFTTRIGVQMPQRFIHLSPFSPHWENFSFLSCYHCDHLFLYLMLFLHSFVFPSLAFVYKSPTHPHFHFTQHRASLFQQWTNFLCHFQQPPTTNQSPMSLALPLFLRT